MRNLLFLVPLITCGCFLSSKDDADPFPGSLRSDLPFIQGTYNFGGWVYSLSKTETGAYRFRTTGVLPETTERARAMHGIHCDKIRDDKYSRLCTSDIYEYCQSEKTEDFEFETCAGVISKARSIPKSAGDSGFIGYALASGSNVPIDDLLITTTLIDSQRPGIFPSDNTGIWAGIFVRSIDNYGALLHKS